MSSEKTPSANTEAFLDKVSSGASNGGASDAPKKRGRPPRAKQEPLPGTGQELIPAVSAAAESYVDLRDQRIALTRQEVEARELLIDLMHKHSLTTYKVGNMTATLESKEKVKVKIESEEDENLEVY